jgi:hypothetical protein
VWGNRVGIGLEYLADVLFGTAGGTQTSIGPGPPPFMMKVEDK